MDRVSEVETPLFARIEALAAQAADDVQADRAVADEVAAVRSEMSSLRADVARLTETLTGGLQAQASRFEGEVRGPLESRLAALEDTLDGVAERLESFARDGASTTADRLSMLARDIAGLGSTVSAGNAELRTFVADRSADSAATLLEAQSTGSSSVVGRVEEAVGGLTGSVREAIDAFAGSVERSLTALGSSVGTALAEARDAHHDHLDEVSGYLDAAMEKAMAGQAELAGLLKEQSTAMAATRTELSGAVTTSRGDVTKAVDGLRQEVATALTASQSAVEASLAASQRQIVAALDTSGKAVKKSLDDNDRTAASRIAEVKRGVDVTSTALDSMATKVTAIAKAGAENSALLGKLDEGWREVAEAVIEESRAAAAAELDEFRTRVGRDLESLRESLRETTATVVDSRSELDAGSQRLDAAGRALLQYLAERDEALEEERDRILRDVLDEFGKGLDGKSRKHLTMRVSEALDRTRDARDAERYRTSKSGAPAPAPVPIVVAAVAAAPVAPARQALGKADALPAVESRRVQPPPAPRPAGATRAPADSSAKSARPVKPAKPAKPAKAATPARAATSVKPAPAAKPAKPAKPAKAARPAEPVKAAKPAKVGAPAAEPVKRSTPGASEPAAPVTRKGRATVDAMPTVVSPSSAIDAATGDGAGFARPTGETADDAATQSANPAGGAVDAFAAAAASRRRFGGRRPRS